RATLPDTGEVVAVKVRRPHLRRTTERDLRLMRVLAFVLSRLCALGETINPFAIVDDFAATLRTELDFREEAAAMVEVAALFRAGGHDRVVVPAPIANMVGERVLVMTFVEGVPVDVVDPADVPDVVGLVRSGVQAWVGAAIGHGVFHGDVHA